MTPARMDRLEAAIRVVLEFNQAFNRHDLEAMLQRMSEECVFETRQPKPDGSPQIGRRAVAQYWQGFFRSYPQVHCEIEEIFSLGLHCILRWRTEWVDDAGVQQHVRGVDLFKVTDGLISEELSYAKG